MLVIGNRESWICSWGHGGFNVCSVLLQPQRLRVGRMHWHASPRSSYKRSHSASALTHETRETLKGTGYPDAGVDLDEDALGGVDVDLEEAGLVEGRVEEGEETLVGNVWTRVGNVPSSLGENTLVVVTVEQSILCLLSRRVLAARSRRNAVRLEACL